MKRFILVTACIVLVCAAAFWFICLPHGVSELEAKRGVLDLVGADFSDKIFALDGEWEFYYGAFHAPEVFKSGRPEGGAFIRVPRSWDEAGYPPEGFATYRLRLLTDETELLLYLPEVFTASKIWADGEMLYQVGTPGRSRDESAVGMRSTFVPVRPKEGGTELVLHVSNYDWMDAGLSQRIMAGARNVLLPRIILRLLLLAVFVGALMIIGVYHFALYVNNRRDTAYLVFAAFCLVAIVRFCMETNSFAELLSVEGIGSLSLDIYTKSLVVTCVLLAVFTHAVFKIPYGRFRGAVYIASTAFILFLPVVLPYPLMHPIWIVVAYIPMILSGIAALRKKRLRKSPYNALYLVSTILVVTWGTVTGIRFRDVLFVPGVVTHIFLIMSQCFILAENHAEARRREAELAAENAALQRYNTFKSDLIATVSHETRTPLAVLSLYSELIAQELRREGVKEQAAKDLDRISGEALRIAGLMDDLSANARRGEGPAKTRLDLAELIRGAGRMYGPILERRGLALAIRLPDGLPPVFGAASEITQVLFNLFNNARAHMEDGEIAVSAAQDGRGFVAVTVADTGTGIAKALLPRIFERGVSGERGGQGLGLSICKEIVAGHGGEITIDSEPGKGTAARFTLPIYREGIHG
jgi:signal transduction histidine kinase